MISLPASEPAFLQRREAACGELAVVMRTFEAGGAERDMILLCNELVTMGMDITILVLRKEGPLEPLIDPAVRIVQVPGQRIRYAIPGLRKAMRDLRPAVLLSSESSVNLCCLAAVRLLPRAARPKVVLREVASPSPAQKADPSWQSRVAYRVLRRFYGTADRVITLTQGARSDLVDNFSVPSHKVVAMRSNAVVTREVSERIARWDCESGREPGLIVQVARLSPEKNQRLLLRAVSLLPTALPWKLALVGDGPERPALEALARELGLAERVAFIGFVKDPFAWMMRAQLAVCSSNYEGLCNAIIEALACGTPVVSTDCPYGPREILQHGQYGTLVPVGDAGALAHAIERALASPVDRMLLMERGRNYTAERAADNFLDIVSELSGTVR